MNIDYEGVYPLDHERVPDEVRTALGITVPKKITVGAPPNLKPATVSKSKAAPSASAAPTLPGTATASSDIDDL